MDLLAENQGRVYASVAVDELGEFLARSPKGFFASLIWDHTGEFSDSDRATVAKTLLDAGCRYVVCGGQQCPEWQDAVDLEFVKQHLDDDEAAAEASHVMTTWHEGESPDEVAFFFVFLTISMVMISPGIWSYTQERVNPGTTSTQLSGGARWARRRPSTSGARNRQPSGEICCRRAVPELCPR